MSNIGIFDELVAAARRIDLGSNSPGQSTSIGSDLDRMKAN